MKNQRDILDNILNSSSNRFDFWSNFLKDFECNCISEIGVYRGKFAEYILKNCLGISKYYMVDPWRNLEDWNKPSNTYDDEFENFFNETVSRTQFAQEKIEVLRGKTLEVIDKIGDEALDFVYIDGDHTLKGITLDLLSIWNKVKLNGFIGGDDFCSSIWQHSEEYEPTLVFPFAVYFAEAKNTTIYALPYNQFLITKEQSGFKFIDLSNDNYKRTNLKELMENKTRKHLPKKRKNILFVLKRKLKNFLHSI